MLCCSNFNHNIDLEVPQTLNIKRKQKYLVPHSQRSHTENPKLWQDFRSKNNTLGIQKQKLLDCFVKLYVIHKEHSQN
jgi:hypothetical protein